MRTVQEIHAAGELLNKTIIALALAFVIIFLSTGVSLAQQQTSDIQPMRQQRASDAAIGGGINEIVSQRDIAQARAIEYAGKLAEAAAEIERLKKLCGEPCKKDEKK